MKFTTDGLIIKENNVGESDRVVLILTGEQGLVSAFAPGARRPKSKNLTPTALLSYSNFTISRAKDINRITESEAHNVFFGLRSDIEKYSLAQYICELCQVLVPYDVESGDFLRLALNSLYFLSNGEKSIHLIKAVTELRMMTVAGFMPDLVGCRECGSDGNFPLFLDLPGGEILCGECKSRLGVQGSFYELDRTVFAAMRHIVYSPFEKIYSFSVPETEAEYLSHVTEGYLLAQTGHRFKTLDFFHSLKTQV